MNQSETSVPDEQEQPQNAAAPGTAQNNAGTTQRTQQTPDSSNTRTPQPYDEASRLQRSPPSHHHQQSPPYPEQERPRRQNQQQQHPTAFDNLYQQFYAYGASSLPIRPISPTTRSQMNPTYPTPASAPPPPPASALTEAPPQSTQSIVSNYSTSNNNNETPASSFRTPHEANLNIAPVSIRQSQSNADPRASVMSSQSCYYTPAETAAELARAASRSTSPSTSNINRESFMTALEGSFLRASTVDPSTNRASFLTAYEPPTNNNNNNNNEGSLIGTSPSKEVASSSPNHYRSPTDEDLGYIPMKDNDDKNNNHNPNSAVGSSTNADTSTVRKSLFANTAPTTQISPTKATSSNSNSNSNSSNPNDDDQSTTSWFAATPEDWLSVSILRNEIKDLLLELFHFLRNRHWKKKLLTVLVVIAFCLVITDLFFFGYINRWIEAFLMWMTTYPALSTLAFIGIFVLATLFFVPPTVLLLGAGWAFADSFDLGLGILLACLSCFLGSVIGALLSFVRARYMMRDLIYLFAKRYPVVRAADQALKTNGFRIMLLLRLCPLIPFHGLNYLGGITGVPWDTFVFTLVAILPYQFLVILMGASAESYHRAKQSNPYLDNVVTDDDADIFILSDIQEHRRLGLLVLTIGGALTFVLAMLLTFRFTKKELQKELHINDEEMESYIRNVRRMSMIDLYSDEIEDELTNMGYEVHIETTGLHRSTAPTKSPTHNKANSLRSSEGSAATQYYSSMFEI